MRNNRILLGQISNLLNLKPLLKDEPNEVSEAFENFDKILVLKYDCDPMRNKIYFELSDENFEQIEFIVLTENIKNSVEMLQKLSKTSNVSIISVYAIIFSYIGITIIRKAFFEQAHKIWTLEIPNAYRLEEYVYLILYARLNGDLYTEEMFYNKVIDLFRAPEIIKRLTGPVINPDLMRKKKKLKYL